MKEHPTATLLVFDDCFSFDGPHRITWNLDLTDYYYMASHRAYETEKAAVIAARRVARKWGIEITGIEGVNDPTT